MDSSPSHLDVSFVALSWLNQALLWIAPQSKRQSLRHPIFAESINFQPYPVKIPPRMGWTKQVVHWFSEKISRSSLYRQISIVADTYPLVLAHSSGFVWQLPKQLDVLSLFVNMFLLKIATSRHAMVNPMKAPWKSHSPTITHYFHHELRLHSIQKTSVKARPQSPRLTQRTCSFRIQGVRWPPHRRCDPKRHLPDLGGKESTKHTHDRHVVI